MEIYELSDKEFGLILLRKFNEIQENTDSQLNKNEKQNKRAKNPLEILKLKNTITELKNLIESFKSRLDHTEERISDLENRTLQMTQLEEQK